MNEKLELLTPGNCQLIFIDHQPQMAFGAQSIDCQALIGEQIVAPIQRMRAGAPVTAAWFRQECAPRISGLPSRLSDKHSEAVILTKKEKDPSARD